MMEKNITSGKHYNAKGEEISEAEYNAHAEFLKKANRYAHDVYDGKMKLEDVPVEFLSKVNETVEILNTPSLESAQPTIATQAQAMHDGYVEGVNEA